MNNTTDLMDNPGSTFEGYRSIIQIILFCVVCFVGLVGNTLVIYVVIRFSKMQTVTNMYIVNLAIADECFLIGLPFLIATMIRGSWIFGHIACKAYMISTSINQFTSSIFLCVMSADRYIAVCHPISSPRWRTPFISKVVSLLAWTTSILLIIPIINHAREVGGAPDHMSCVIMFRDLDDGQANMSNITNSSMLDTDSQGMPIETIYARYIFTFSFCIPLCLILLFYFRVVMKLRNVGPKNKSKEKKRSHRKVTNLVLTVITVYVICWLPYWVMQLANKPVEDASEQKLRIAMHLLTSCLSYSNSAINPILYAFLSDNFKKSFLKACTCAAMDVNAQLHLENSVFPRKNKQNSERARPTRATSICPNEEECDEGPLVNRTVDTTSISLTSRTTTTTSVTGAGLRNAVKNGVISQPTSL
ncbi:somatostatin receptor type 2-like isoform X1 [Aethina tumida]|uniref:somatostatin receptor type 2-like isoform X1 n=1 Tax=Aethina tumida TaxID=116153 RepID=UPI002147CFAB|nr:somatostatin receptor type 2-like isoform X1 [Aethina tumida]XP_049823496.1 somatostatin receptor type 2-like isoform X1 [Aethina tumida]XP_049823497.1 somatostatin receptor type 2-like isoform X1 [Aethina tumida]XP_049823498.1 somatostatin receptor type 2-like isoform X1 [Aethina tumida]